MTRVAYVDAIGGAAGDMLLAGLLDAGASLGAVQHAVEAVVPGTFSLTLESVDRAGIRATHLQIGRIRPVLRRTPQALLAAVEGAALPTRVRDRALRTLTYLASAEARVHGLAPSDLILEELGDDDTLLDVVGVAAALESFEVGRLFIGPLPLGRGGRAAKHDRVLTLLAPATLELLRGFHVRGAGNGETITPTAAALFAAIGIPATRPPSLRLEALGYGAGTRNPRRRPNVVRILLGAGEGSMDGPTANDRNLVVLETNLDDLTPELIADAADSLRSAGALDVWLTSIQMKKGRPGSLLSALCDAAHEPDIRRTFFEATSTFGLRAYPVRRTELERDSVDVLVGTETVRVKIGFLDGVPITFKPEHDDVVSVARKTKRPLRLVYGDAVATARSSIPQFGIPIGRSEHHRHE